MARPRNFQQSDVFSQAMLTFWQHGYTATSMKQLEAATQLATSSLYHAFGGKEALFAAALEHYVEQVVEVRIRTYLSNDQPPLQGIRDFLISAISGVPEAVRGHSCLLINSAAELGSEQAQFARLIRAGMKRVEAGFLRQLQRAKEQGLIAPQRDLALTAKELGIFMAGLLVASRLNPDARMLAPLIDHHLAGLCDSTQTAP